MWKCNGQKLDNVGQMPKIKRKTKDVYSISKKVCIE